jgi:4-amino-4-deoxy-L-arabinose transferase-like glycosyltransferase
MTFGKTDALILGLTFLAALMVFALVADDIGMNVDEGPYIFAGGYYSAWIVDTAKTVFSPTGLKRQWGSIEDFSRGWFYNHEHPPIAKTVYGIFGRLFEQPLGQILAPRIGALFFQLVLLISVYFLITPRYGRLAATFAMLAILSHPRLLAHSSMCGLDMPAVATAMLFVLFFVKGLECRICSALCGVALGLAVGTKINNPFIGIAVAGWGLMFHRTKAIRNIVFMATLGPLTFFATWPWMWKNTIARVQEYMQFHLNHMIEPVFYMGATFRGAPWHYAIVMLLVATPLVLVLFAGSVFARRWKRPVDDLLILLAVLVVAPILVVMPESVPIYNGLRLFLMSATVISVLAGIGAAQVYDRLKQTSWFVLRKRELVAGIGAVLLLPGFFGSIVTHPFEMTYYGAQVGYRTGAMELGFNLVPWGQADAGLIEWLNEKFPDGADIAWDSGAATAIAYYRTLGKLNPKIRVVRGGKYWIVCSNFSYAGFPDYWLIYNDLHPEYKRIGTYPDNELKIINIYERLNP